jgi:alpha/beta superfamily hydrolase
MISVAPPVGRYEFSEMDRPGCAWMVIQGDEDDVVSADSVIEWANSQDPPPDLIVMQQAGHFFHRRLMDLRGLVKNGVRDQLPEANKAG